MSKKKEKFFNMKLSEDKTSADIFIYGEITKYAWEEYGELSSLTFKNELDALGDDVERINLYINSPGGSIFEGMAIIAMLQRHKAEIYSFVDGVGASCASVIPMISKHVTMYENTFLMIHHDVMGAYGNAKELREAANEIERFSDAMCQFYLNKAGEKLSKDKLYEMLDSGDTWLTAQEAYDFGLCDEIVPAINAVASLENKWKEKYSNIPAQLISEGTPQPQMSVEEQELRNSIIANSEANLLYLNQFI